MYNDNYGLNSFGNCVKCHDFYHEFKYLTKCWSEFRTQHDPKQIISLILMLFRAASILRYSSRSVHYVCRRMYCISVGVGKKSSSQMRHVHYLNSENLQPITNMNSISRRITKTTSLMTNMKMQTFFLLIIVNIMGHLKCLTATLSLQTKKKIRTFLNIFSNTK